MASEVLSLFSRNMNRPLTNAEMSQLHFDDLIEHIESSDECSVERRLHNLGSVRLYSAATCGSPISGTTGVEILAEFPPKKWWEVWYHETLLSVDEEPISHERRKELDEKDRDPHYQLVSKERIHAKYNMFFPMDPLRLPVEGLPDAAQVAVTIPRLGRVETSAKEARTFLRGWERERC